MRKKKILVAPLNWGLGHAARCIPIIRALEEEGFEPILASDGPAIELLKKEFPNLRHTVLPSYNIRYAKKGKYLKWKLLLKSMEIHQTIQKEKKITENLVKEYDLYGIISDNRWGVRSDQLEKNVFITHQINVLSGSTSLLSSFIQQRYIGKYNQCWVPDTEGSKNLSGRLGHPAKKPEKVKYIGVLSRMERKDIPLKYDYLAILSGPEPQRSILETLLLKELNKTDKEILLIRGIFHEKTLELSKGNNITVKNHLIGKALEEAMNSSKYIIARSGYTTIMDLCHLNKKAFFIPTPGQYEQEYLAKRLAQQKLAPYCKQEDFRFSSLEEIENFEGLGNFGNHAGFRNLFTFFESE